MQKKIFRRGRVVPDFPVDGRRSHMCMEFYRAKIFLAEFTCLSYTQVARVTILYRTNLG